MIPDGKPVRCFCSKSPLLAVVGRDDRTGEPVVHIKAWKGDKLFVEAIVISGIVKLKCRECGKWNRIRMVRGAPRVQPQDGSPLDDLYEEI